MPVAERPRRWRENGPTPEGSQHELYDPPRSGIAGETPPIPVSRPAPANGWHPSGMRKRGGVGAQPRLR